MVKKGTAPAGAGYIKSRSMDGMECYPTELGGTETTYYGDYLWNNSGATSGLFTVLRGAYARFAGYAGVSAVNMDYGALYVNSYISSALCEFAGDWPIEPTYYA
jgi:hypothetical protein